MLSSASGWVPTEALVRPRTRALSSSTQSVASQKREVRSVTAELYSFVPTPVPNAPVDVEPTQMPNGRLVRIGAGEHHTHDLGGGRSRHIRASPFVEIRSKRVAPPFKVVVEARQGRVRRKDVGERMQCGTVM